MFYKVLQVAANILNFPERCSKSLVWLQLRACEEKLQYSQTKDGSWVILLQASAHPAPLVLLWLWVGPAEVGRAVAVGVTALNERNWGLQRRYGKACLQAVSWAAVHLRIVWEEGEKYWMTKTSSASLKLWFMSSALMGLKTPSACAWEELLQFSLTKQ